MKADRTFINACDFTSHFIKLHKERRKRKHKERRKREKESLLNKRGRGTLSPSQRVEVLKKTANRCHICGGKIEAHERRDADHVFAHAYGSMHSADNFLIWLV